MSDPPSYPMHTSEFCRVRETEDFLPAYRADEPISMPPNAPPGVQQTTLQAGTDGRYILFQETVL